MTKFEHRRGIVGDPTTGMMCVYDNNPVGLVDGTCQFRERWMDLFKTWLRQQGVREIRDACFPKDGYTASAGVNVA